MPSACQSDHRNRCPSSRKCRSARRSGQRLCANINCVLRRTSKHLSARPLASRTFALPTVLTTHRRRFWSAPSNSGTQGFLAASTLKTCCASGSNASKTCGYYRRADRQAHVLAREGSCSGGRHSPQRSTPLRQCVLELTHTDGGLANTFSF